MLRKLRTIKLRTRTWMLICAAALLLTTLGVYTSHAQYTRAETNKSEPLAQPTLPTEVYVVKDVRITVEIADEPTERRRGLSYRNTLEANSGMLFVYPAEQKLAFTMRHASIPLSIAFMDKNMNILEIFDMEPFTDGPYPSAHLAQFALEMNQGWFAKHKIKPGDRLRPG